MLAVVSAGPPADVVELCRVDAWRWAGPRSPFLRAASPPNRRPRVERPSRARGRGRTPGARRCDVVRGLPSCSTGASWSTVAARARGFDDRLRRRRSRGAVAGAHARATTGARSRHARTPTSPTRRAPHAWRRARRGRVRRRRRAQPRCRAGARPRGRDRRRRRRRGAAGGAGADVARARRRCSSAPAAPGAAVTVRVAGADGRGRSARRSRRGTAAGRRAAGWPRVEVVDRRDEPPGRGLLTAPLADALRTRRATGRAVCVLNRRGRVRLLACRTCHELARCERAARPSSSATRARVHGARPCARWSACSATAARSGRVRAGVTRVREELAALLPRTRRSVDVDADTDDVARRRRRRRHRGRAAPAPRGAAVPALVAYLDLDQELLAPRYRAAEQALWLARARRPAARGRTRGDAPAGADPRPRPRGRARGRGGRPELVDRGRDRTAPRRSAIPPFGALAELTGDDRRGRAPRARRCRAASTVRRARPERRRARSCARRPATTLCDALHAALAAAPAAGRVRGGRRPRIGV